MVNFHPHVLNIIFDEKKWFCDSIAQNQVCGRKQDKKKTVIWPYKRYSCINGCNFCICDWCAFLYKIKEQYIYLFIKFQ